MERPSQHPDPLVHGGQAEPLLGGVPAKGLLHIKPLPVIFHTHKNPRILFSDANRYMVGLRVLCYVRKAFLQNPVYGNFAPR
jgi:hypothetical protein